MIIRRVAGVLAVLLTAACTSGHAGARRTGTSGAVSGSGSGAGPAATSAARPATGSLPRVSTRPTGTGIATGTAPARGAARLTLDAVSTRLELRLCQRTGNGGVSVTAAGSGRPAPTLVLNVQHPASASTLVFTVRNTDNSFTVHSMGSGRSVRAAVRGTRVSAAGPAVREDFDAQGHRRGDAQRELLTFAATCRSVVASNPPPSYAPTTHPAR